MRARGEACSTEAMPALTFAFVREKVQHFFPRVSVAIEHRFEEGMLLRNLFHHLRLQNLLLRISVKLRCSEHARGDERGRGWAIV